MKRLTQIFQALLGVVALIFTAIIAFGRLTWRTIRNWWKKRSKWIRRSIIAIIMIVSVGFAALVVYAFYENNYGRSYRDRRLSNNMTLRSFSDNKWRVYDCVSKEYTTRKINWLSEAFGDDSLAVYALPNKRGYINVNTGRIVIDAETNGYRKAWVFSEGLAAVMKEGKIGFINAENEVVIPFQFDYSGKPSSWWGFGYLFHDGYCIMTNKDGDIGLIDKNGNWVIEPAYDDVCTPHDSGYRIIIKDHKYGILDSVCNVVYPAEYCDIEILPNGFVLSKDGKQWQVDFEGNIVQPFMFDYTYYLKYPIGCDECGDIQYAIADYAKYQVANRLGIMNRITGESITLAIFSDIHMLSKDLFEVKDSESFERYLVDTQGNVVSQK